MFKIILLTYDCKMKKSCIKRIKRIIKLGSSNKIIRTLVLEKLESCLLEFCQTWFERFQTFNNDEFIKTFFLYVNDIFYSALILNEIFISFEPYLKMTPFKWILHHINTFLISKLIDKICNIFSNQNHKCKICFRIRMGVSFLILCFNKTISKSNFTLSYQILKYTTPSFIRCLELENEIITFCKNNWIYTPMELRVDARKVNPLHRLVQKINTEIAENRKLRIQEIKYIDLNLKMKLKNISRCNNFFCINYPKYICGSCLTVKYCSKECHLTAWNDHKYICKYIKNLLSEVD